MQISAEFTMSRFTDTFTCKCLQRRSFLFSAYQQRRCASESLRAGWPKTRVLFCWRWLPYARNRGRTESARYLGLKAHAHSAVNRATDAGAARQRMETA